MVGTEPEHLLGTQWKHREHPELTSDESQARIGSSDPLAHRVDAVAHAVELDQPARVKSAVLENDVGAGGAMIGWHRPHFARALENVTHRRSRGFNRSRLVPQRPDPVAVTAEVLVAALRDNHLLACLQHQPDAERIPLEAARKASEREVDQRNYA